MENFLILALLPLGWIIKLALLSYILYTLSIWLFRLEFATSPLAYLA